MPARGEIAFAGRRVKQKILLALALSSAIPLMILIYALHVHVIPLLRGPEHRLVVTALQILIVATGFLMAAGGFVIYEVAAAVVRTARMVSVAGRAAEIEERGDEIGSLMGSFSQMLATIEQQANEINRFAAQLDTAYKDLEQTNAKLKEFSFKDELTGLYNRRFFSIRLEEELARYRRFGHPMAVVLIDLDGLKTINDDMGHSAGDDTLRETSQILLKHSRQINVICRYGGDEFAALLVETSKSGALLYAERIRLAVAGHLHSHGRPVTASFGVAGFPEDVASNTDELLQAADEALYAAKRSGKNRVAGYEKLSIENPVESEEKVYP
jgi:diguanylate cyclase (GGDEF)-like protein